MKTHQRKVVKTKKHSPSTSRTQSGVDLQYTSFQSTRFHSDSSEIKNKRCSKRRRAGTLEVIQNVHTRFCEVVDYCTFRLDNRSTKYYHTVPKNVCKLSKRMSARTESHIFERSNLTSIIGFPCNFKLEYDAKNILEGAEIWLFNFFIKNWHPQCSIRGCCQYIRFKAGSLRVERTRN